MAKKSAPKPPVIKVVDEEVQKKRAANLKPLNQRTPEERRRIGALGGKAAAETKRQAKTFREALNWALELPAMKGNPTVDAIRKSFPTITNRDAMVIAMCSEAVKKQNVRAFEAIRDTTGELPAQTVNVQTAQPMTINIKTIE